MVVQNVAVRASKPGLRKKSQIQDDSIMGVRLPPMSLHLILLTLVRQIIAASCQNAAWNVYTSQMNHITFVILSRSLRDGLLSSIVAIG
jgi:hypothetical protein